MPERLYEKILSTTADHLCVYDEDGRYLFASTSGAQSLGMIPSDIIGKTWRELGFPPEIMEPFDARREAVFASGHSRTDITRFPTIQGLRYFEYILEPIENEENRIEAVLCSVRDITERKQAEEALRVALRQLTDAQRIAGLGSWTWDIAQNTTV